MRDALTAYAAARARTTGLQTVWAYHIDLWGDARGEIGSADHADAARATFAVMAPFVLVPTIAKSYLVTVPTDPDPSPARWVWLTEFNVSPDGHEATTRRVWYYQLDPGRSLGKTNPLNDDDLKEFVALQADLADSEKSWTVPIEDIDQETFDLSVKNPNTPEEDPLRDPKEILDEIAALDAESAGILDAIRGLV